MAVTRAGTAPGRAVVAALAARVGAGVREVLALDEEPGGAEATTWRAGPLDDPSVAGRLAGADVVVHVAAPADLEGDLARDAAERRRHAVRSVQAVATAAAAVGASRLVVVTSAMLYGALPGNPPELDDDAPARAPADTGLVGDLIEVEQVALRAEAVHPGLAVTLVRPAALVGPGVDTVVTRHFEAPVLLSVRGASERWQFCHVEDLGEAVAVVVAAGLDGPVAVGSPGALSLDDVVRASGMRKLEFPEGMAMASAERLHRMGALPMPAGDLAYVVHPWVVAADGLRAAGWTARYSNAEALAVLLAEVRGRYGVAGRRLARKDAALGAAGAAVAVMGAAALVRQARVRRGRPGSGSGSGAGSGAGSGG